MNVDRLLHDVEGQLATMAGELGRDESRRREVLDALREALNRERFRLDPDTTVERERERRQLAEELRTALEAVHGSARPEESLDELLKQLGRVVEVDFAAVAASEPGGRLRVVAVRGATAAGVVGARLSDPRVSAALEERRVVRVADAQAEGGLDLAGAPAVRSWAILPLLLEGDAVGALVAGRAALDSFTEEEILRAKSVAFWAAAALVRVRQLAQLRRYATLLEQAVDVAQHVFEGDPTDALPGRILDGACRVGGYDGGLLVLETPRGPSVLATSGDVFAAALGRPAPPELLPAVAGRLPADRVAAVSEALGVAPPADEVLLVPLATPEGRLGCLALLDRDGESSEDRLLEAYASRMAAAWRHASRHNVRP